MAHLVFDVVAKYVQEQHVAEQMHPPGVQKLRGEQSTDPIAHAQPGRNQRICIVDVIDDPVIPKRHCVAEEDADVGDHQGIGDVGGAPRRVVISDRKHVCHAVGLRDCGQVGRAMSRAWPGTSCFQATAPNSAAFPPEAVVSTQTWRSARTRAVSGRPQTSGMIGPRRAASAVSMARAVSVSPHHRTPP